MGGWPRKTGGIGREERGAVSWSGRRELNDRERVGDNLPLSSEWASIFRSYIATLRGDVY